MIFSKAFIHTALLLNSPAVVDHDKAWLHRMDPWPESELLAPLQDENISAPEAIREPFVADSNRIDPTQAMCQKPIPAEPGPARNKWIHRCYTHWVSGRLNKVEAIAFSSQGNNNYGAPTVIAKEGERGWRFGRINESRQALNLWVTDFSSDATRDDRVSIFYFFPRNNMPALRPVEGQSGEFEVFLPTGESIIFDSGSRKIKSGAMLEESYVDLNPNSNLRKFAAVKYVGKGISIRLNRRAMDPRVWSATAKNYAEISDASGKKCFIHPKELFEQTGWCNFKFPTDEGFREYLKTAVDAFTSEPCGITF